MIDEHLGHKFNYQILTALYHILSNKYDEFSIEKNYEDSSFYTNGRKICIGEAKSIQSSSSWTPKQLFYSGKRGPLLQLLVRSKGVETFVFYSNIPIKDEFFSDSKIIIPKEELSDICKIIPENYSEMFGSKITVDILSDFIKKVEFKCIQLDSLEDHIIEIAEQYGYQTNKSNIRYFLGHINSKNYCKGTTIKKHIIHDYLREKGSSSYIYLEIEKNSIEHVLRKDQVFESKQKIPVWSNFEEGKIVERRVLKECIQELEKQKRTIVLGDSASGKSVFLKHVGFILAKKRPVYYLSFKEENREKIEELCKILLYDRKEPLIILDDIHENLNSFNNICKLHNASSKSLVLAGTRLIEFKIRGNSEFERNPILKITAEEIAEEIVKKHIPNDSNLRNHNNFSKLQIQLSKYWQDLWLLEFALNSIDHEKCEVHEEEIYQYILESLDEVFNHKELDQFYDCVFILSVFSKHNIRVEKNYLIQNLKIHNHILEYLLEKHEIIEHLLYYPVEIVHISNVWNLYEKHNIHHIGSAYFQITYILSHQSVAQLYYSAIKFSNCISYNLRLLLGERYEDDFNLFKEYILHSNEDYKIKILKFLMNDNTKGIVDYLLSDGEIMKYLLESMKYEEDLYFITMLYERFIISKYQKEYLNILIKKFKNVIDCKMFVQSIESLFWQMSNKNIRIFLRKIKIRKILKRINWILPDSSFSFLSTIINQNYNLAKIASGIIGKSIILSKTIEHEDFIHLINFMNKLFYYNLGKNKQFNIKKTRIFDYFTKRIDSETNLSQIEIILDFLGETDSINLVLNKKNIKNLVEKVNCSEDLIGVKCLLSSASLFSEDLISRILVLLDKDVLYEKIKTEKDLHDIGVTLYSLRYIAKNDLLLDINSILDSDFIKNKLEDKWNIVDLFHFIKGLCVFNKDLTVFLIDKINSESIILNYDYSFDTVVYPFLEIAGLEEDIAIKLIPNLVQLIRNKEDVLWLTYAATHVESNYNPKILLDIFHHINPSLILEIMEDTYAGDIFMSNLIDGIGKRISYMISHEIIKYVENIN